MTWRQAYTLRRYEIDEGLVWLGQVLMHGVHDLSQCMRAGDSENFGMNRTNDILTRCVFFPAQAASDDDPTVFTERLADGVQRFRDGRINEAAGIDDDEIGTVVRFGGVVTFSTQLRQDLLGIDQGLGTAE